MYLWAPRGLIALQQPNVEAKSTQRSKTLGAIVLRIHVYEPVNKFQKCGYIYSRTPVTRTQKTNEKQFRELARIQVIGVG